MSLAYELDASTVGSGQVPVGLSGRTETSVSALGGGWVR